MPRKPKTTDPKLDKMFQSVVITFSDGRVGVFTGKAMINEENTSLTISSIKFTPPEELPKDCNFAKLRS